jgi:hypothetical protein
VAEDVRGVIDALLRGLSPEAQAAVVGGIAGGVVGGGVGGLLGILGALLGLVVERRMRRSGKIGCELTQELRITWRTVPDRRQLTAEDVAHLEDFARVEAEVEGDLEFFNEKEVDIGLSRLAIVFITEDGEEARLNPTDAQQGILSVNVLSRRWSQAKVSGVISGPSSRLVRDWHTIEVRGALPDHSLYRDPVRRKVGAELRIGS